VSATDDRLNAARLLEASCALAHAAGEPAVAARLAGAAAEQYEQLGTWPRPPIQAAVERIVATVRGVLGETTYSAALSAGRALSFEDALAEVRTLVESNGTPACDSAAGARPERRHGLTRREVDVLRLLADGLTDRDIAERLFITRRTASNHVAAILAKLDVPNRRAAAAEARRLGLR
jgi:DNA-binding NarL/FixJ family response regulator